MHTKPAKLARRGVLVCLAAFCLPQAKGLKSPTLELNPAAPVLYPWGSVISYQDLPPPPGLEENGSSNPYGRDEISNSATKLYQVEPSGDMDRSTELSTYAVTAWHMHCLARSVHLHGSAAALAQRLAASPTLEWSSAFTGGDAPCYALQSIQVLLGHAGLPALRLTYTLGFERDSRVSRLLLQNSPPTVLAVDVTHLLPEPVMQWLHSSSPTFQDIFERIVTQELYLVPHVWCTRTKRYKTYHLDELHIAGLTCVDYSTMGNQKRLQGQSSLALMVWVRLILQEKSKWLIVENLTSWIWQRLGSSDWLGKSYRLVTTTWTPQSFAIPVARVRTYGLLVLQDCKTSLSPWLEAPRHFSIQAPPILASSVFCPDLRPTLLTKQEMRYRTLYERYPALPDVIDLSQNPAFRDRRSLVKGALPTLTRTCKMYCERLHRILSPPEALLAMGFPASEQMAARLGIRPMNIQGLSSTALRSIAGNSMHVACVGGALWCLIIEIRPHSLTTVLESTRRDRHSHNTLATSKKGVLPAAAANGSEDEDNHPQAAFASMPLVARESRQEGHHHLQAGVQERPMAQIEEEVYPQGTRTIDLVGSDEPPTHMKSSGCGADAAATNNTADTNAPASREKRSEADALSQSPSLEKDDQNNRGHFGSTLNADIGFSPAAWAYLELLHKTLQTSSTLTARSWRTVTAPACPGRVRDLFPAPQLKIELLPAALQDIAPISAMINGTIVALNVLAEGGAKVAAF